MSIGRIRQSKAAERPQRIMAIGERGLKGDVRLPLEPDCCPRASGEDLGDGNLACCNRGERVSACV